MISSKLAWDWLPTSQFSRPFGQSIGFLQAGSVNKNLNSSISIHLRQLTIGSISIILKDIWIDGAANELR